MEGINLNTPLFILSSPRSGSTLLRLNLNKIPGLVSIPETFFWLFKDANKKLNPAIKNDRISIFDNLKNFHFIKVIPLDRKRLETRVIESSSSWNDIFEHLVISCLEAENTSFNSDSIICEKSPYHLSHQDDILKSYPKAKFVYLVRDPRAVIGSLKAYSWSTSNIITNVVLWRKGIKKMIYKDNSVFIKYEDLVTNPAKEIEKITKLLSLNVGNVSELLSKETKSDVETGKRTNLSVLKPINQENIDKWKTQLSNADCDIQIIEKLCEKEMKQFDYQFMNKPKKFPFYVSFLFIWLHSVSMRVLSKITTVG